MTRLVLLIRQVQGQNQFPRMGLSLHSSVVEIYASGKVPVLVLAASFLRSSLQALVCDSSVTFASEEVGIRPFKSWSLLVDLLVPPCHFHRFSCSQCLVRTPVLLPHIGGIEVPVLTPPCCVGSS